MKIAAAKADDFCRHPDPGIAAVLVYGPDRGLVQERAEELARTVVEDLGDPFRVSELSARAILADPALLADEAAALALTGGRRVVRVRDAGNDIAEAFATMPAGAGEASLVVAEAGELTPASPLRKHFEAAETAAAVACYLDDEATLEAVIRQTLTEHGLAVDAAALAFLVASLGGDRKLTRAELAKLALYVGDQAEAVDEAAARACIGDSAAIGLDDLADAVAGGDHAGVGRALARLRLDGTHAVAMLRAVERHFQRLHLVAASTAAGVGLENALAALRPRLFYKRRGAFLGQLRRWPPANSVTALELLLEAEIDCKTTGFPANAVCGQALTRLTQAAARRR